MNNLNLCFYKAVKGYFNSSLAPMVSAMVDKVIEK